MTPARANAQTTAKNGSVVNSVHGAQFPLCAFWVFFLGFGLVPFLFWTAPFALWGVYNKLPSAAYAEEGFDNHGAACGLSRHPTRTQRLWRAVEDASALSLRGLALLTLASASALANIASSS